MVWNAHRKVNHVPHPRWLPTRRSYTLPKPAQSVLCSLDGFRGDPSLPLPCPTRNPGGILLLSTDCKLMGVQYDRHLITVAVSRSSRNQSEPTVLPRQPFSDRSKRGASQHYGQRRQDHSFVPSRRIDIWNQ